MTFLRTLTLALALLAAPFARADVVADWNKIAFDTVTASHESLGSKPHAIAMVHVAMFETLNFIEGRYTSRFVVQSPKLAGTSREAAAAGAAHQMLTDLFPDRRDALDTALKASLDAIKNTPALTGSVTMGKSVASIIYALRRPQRGDAAMEPWLVDAAMATQPTASAASMQPVNATFGAKREPTQHFGPVVDPLGWNPAVAQAIAAEPIDLIQAARIHALVAMAAADAYLIGGDAAGTREVRQTFIDLDGRPSVAVIDVNVATRPPYACKSCAAATAAATIIDAELGSNDSAAIGAAEDMGRQIGQYALRHHYRAY